MGTIRYHLVAGVVLSLVVLASVVAPRAGAYSRGGIAPENGTTISKCGPKVYYSFVGGDAGWTDSLKSTVRSGINNWESVGGSGGGQLVDLVEGSGSPHINIKRVNMSALGYGNCAEGVLKLKTSLDGSDLKGIAAHEMGHVLGLAHVGRGDSIQDGDRPATMMAGPCLAAQSDVAALASLTNDDRAALTQRQGGSAMHANPSYERSLNGGWTTTNGNASRASGGAVGSNHLSVNPTGTGTQYIRVWQDVLVFKAGNHDGAAYLKKNSGTVGSVFLRIAHRPYTASNGFCTTTGDGEYRFEREVVANPSTSWTRYVTPSISLSYNRIGLRVLMRSELKERLPDGSFALRPVKIDDAKARER